MLLDARGAASQAACYQAGYHEPETTTEAGGESPMAPFGHVNVACRGTAMLTWTDGELGGDRFNLPRQVQESSSAAAAGQSPRRNAPWVRRARQERRDLRCATVRHPAGGVREITFIHLSRRGHFYPSNSGAISIRA